MGPLRKQIRGFAEAQPLLNSSLMRIFTAFGLLLLCSCTGDLVELGAGSRADLSGSFGSHDMAQGGGGEMGPSAKFFPDIQNDVDRLGCTIGACHGNGTGTALTMKMGVTAQADIDANYMHVMNDVNTTSPSQSPFLQKPTNGSGVLHSGTKPIGGPSDPTYIKWLNWIQAGAPKQ
jgi:hypothetical protein